jgi:hypothetical protein
VRVQWNDDVNAPFAYDQTDALYPMSRAFDGFTHLATRWTTDLSSFHMICIDFGSSVLFDTIVFFFNGNRTWLHDDLFIQADDTEDFTNPSELISRDVAGVSPCDRLILPQCVTARYLMILMNWTDAATHFPSEVFIGKRCQMQTQPDYPVTWIGVDNAAGESQSPAGAVVRRPRFNGRTRLEQKYQIDSAGCAASVRSLLKSTEPVLYCQNPHTAYAEQIATTQQIHTADVPLFIGHMDPGQAQVPEVETSGLYTADVRMTEQGPRFFWGQDL